MIAFGKIKEAKGRQILIETEIPLSYAIERQKVGGVELRFTDGRGISPDQRRKIFATIRDISIWSGHDPEYLRSLLTWDFRCESGAESFSLSNVDMSTARDFLTYLIEFCFTHSVPTHDPLLDRTDDIDRYLYQCLAHRKCAICNEAGADVHHLDAVGMGRDREDIVHVGLNAIALCRKHHAQAHNMGKDSFCRKYHVNGIRLDEHLCKLLNLRRNTHV